MSIALRILAAGPAVSVQDGGRRGWLRYGVTAAGPMDPIAHATANLALGRARDAAAIEISNGGIELTVEGGAVDVALAGGGFDVRLDGAPMPSMLALRLEEGARLAVRAGRSGSWATLAVAGDIDLPPMLGSLATHTRTGFGGLEGRGLRAGDMLPLRDVASTLDGAYALLASWLEPSDSPVRVVKGPQDDYFTPEEMAAFLARTWRLSAQSDRMAYGLEGERLHHLKGHDIVSDGIVHGAIQVPGTGQPFVLMADRQPTGGYPKIATVISTDLGRMAQFRPGEEVRFAAVSINEAVEIRRRMESLLAAKPQLQPLRRSDFSSSFLLSQNLISGWVSACD